MFVCLRVCEQHNSKNDGWVFCAQFFRFFIKRPRVVEFSRFCSESLHGDTDWRCCVKISWNLPEGKSAISCVIYLTKKFRLPLKLSLLFGSCPKSARATMCSQSSRFHPNRFTSSGAIAERVNTVLCPVGYFHNLPEAMLRFGRIIIQT